MLYSDQILIHLVRLAIGTSIEKLDSGQSVHWSEVFETAKNQSVDALACDGLNILYQSRPELFKGTEFQKIKYDWFGRVISYERDYKAYTDTVTSLAHFYNLYGIKMMMLKGYSLSLHWPVPNHRPTGDIDIYLYGRRRQADDALASALGIRINKSIHHHSVFRYNGRMVENHYDFIHTESHGSASRIEARFKKLSEEDGIEILPNVFAPSAQFEVLFTIRHAACHFAAKQITLRQLLDCSLLVRDVNDQVDWGLFWTDVQMMGMSGFVIAIAYISDKYLGIDRKLFHIPQAVICPDNDSVSERVFEDILHPDFRIKEPDKSIKRLIFMWRRWWAHRWKHKLVYSDSLISSFVTQAISHIVKPEID